MSDSDPVRPRRPRPCRVDPVPVAVSALVAVAALLMGAVAWWFSQDDAAATAAPPEVTSLTLTFRTAPGRIVHIEGARPSFTLTGPGGQVPAPSTTLPPESARSGTLTWTRLDPGRYRLVAGLRPCGRTCDQPNLLVDRCAIDIVVVPGAGDVDVAVLLREGHACIARP